MGGLAAVSLVAAGLLVGVEPAGAQPAGAEPPRRESVAASPLPELSRLADLMPSSERSNPTAFTSVGQRVYFYAETPALGVELWRTDGTTAGTLPVADFTPGPEGGLFGTPFVLDATMFFSAGPQVDGVADAELWRTTSFGTVQRVRDINPGAEGSNPTSFTAVGSTVYFVARSPTGREIWSTSATGSASKVGGPDGPSDLTGIEDGVAFREGDELWFTDGTAAGTAVVREFDDIGSGSIRAFDGEAYFVARDDGSGYDLWRTDGTEAGTVRVTDLDISSLSLAPRLLGGHDGFVYFTADDGTTGRDLWRTSGSGATKAEIAPGTAGASSIGDFVAFGGTAVFRANPVATGAELYKLDAEGLPVLVEDTAPGALDGLAPGAPVPAGDRLYFVGGDGTTSGLYSSTSALDATGTSRVREMFESGTNLATVGAGLGDAFVFRGFDDFGGTEPWISDGTAAGTRELADLNTGGQSSRPSGWAAVGDRVIFSAFAEGLGLEMHLTDGTTGGTRLVKDLNVGPVGSYSASPSAELSGGQLATGAFEGLSSRLLVTDGSRAGTRFLDRPAPDSEAVTFAGRAYYNTMPQVGGGLYTTDGTLAGTQPVFDFNPSGDDNVHGLHVLGGSLYFNARQAGQPDGLWRVGASGDPVLVKLLSGKVFVTGEVGNAVATSGVIGDTLYFSVRDLAGGDIELWRSDGTAAGTVLVEPIPGSATGHYGDLSLWNGQLVFVSGRQVWTSDGTAAGTEPITALASVGEVLDLAVLGDDVLFVGDEGQGWELYATNGVPAQTRLVSDINPTGSAFESDSDFLDSQLLVELDSHVYFGADDGSRGRELWRTDATTAGTELIREFQPGALEGDPSELEVIGSSLYLAANDGSGSEPWRLSIPDVIAPALKLVAKRKQKQGNKVAVKVRVGVDEAARVVVAGKALVGRKKLPLKTASTGLGAGATKTLVLKAKNAATAKKITKALKKWRQAPKKQKKKLAVKVQLQGSAVDAAGNRARVARTITLT